MTMSVHLEDWAVPALFASSSLGIPVILDFRAPPSVFESSFELVNDASGPTNPKCFPSKFYILFGFDCQNLIIHLFPFELYPVKKKLKLFTTAFNLQPENDHMNMDEPSPPVGGLGGPY